MPKIVDAEVRRQEVVQAVFRIIASDGLHRASLREVADEAGLAVGSVRHYFASSDELLVYSFASVVDRIVARLEAALALVEDSEGAEHHNAVLNLLGQLLPLDEESAVDACVWMAFRQAARITPVLAPEAERSHRSVAAVIGRLMVLLRPQDVDNPQALVTEAERLLATVDGLCMHALLQPEWMTAAMCSDVLEAHLQTLQAASARV
ncbi:MULTISPECIES: TetR/AcrR family transcriptional regulator [Paenarthrobacter]|uniref:TetR/AcrR family transcriptional regulator n=1 Tax=Paenarthrobacter TaxID=1742992 RepID=UPI00074D3D7C|nr:TetR family transcriptional regulator C-terminal domain-containing protein [Paenarthrobacter ureafaciens]AMB41150.1 TetR family transcriptional regulator [Arthrobacter sp. ATCC 21022]KUR62636.1 TetR family transcriptional regulator [Arthrobacter sp. ATCC 21022]RWW99801.1 TetR/AcrR family transcriptional regulator [Paenarthrobacter ureafaciens]